VVCFKKLETVFSLCTERLVVVRAIGVHLLVVVLLACPFPCLGRAAAGSGAACAGGNCGGDDDCCPASGSNSGQGAPRTPERIGGGTCLCHGAVMDRHTPSVTLDHQLIAVLPTDELSRQLGPLIADSGLFLSPSACDFASAVSGRTLRAHIASLLL
jgi:hypothetical protein